MKTISRVFCVTLLMASFFACKKSDGPPSQISVDRSAISLGLFQGYTDSFEIQSNTAWQLQLSPASAAQWMQVSTTQGNAGKTVVKVSTVAVNTTTQTATISIKSARGATSPVEIAVLQKIYAVDLNKMVGGNQLDEIYAMARTADGGFVIAGTTTSDESGDIPVNNGYYDAFVVKLTAAGAISWSKTFGGNNLDILSSIAVTPDGGFIACGHTDSYSSGDIPATNGARELWVLKLNTNGEKEWSRCYGGTNEDVGKSISVAPDGRFVIIGHTYSENTGDVGDSFGGLDLWVLKLDQSGNIVKNSLFGGSGNERAQSVISTADRGIIIAATTTSNNSGNVGTSHGDRDAWVLKLDANGDILWNKLFGGADFDELYALAATPDNGFVLTGYTESDNSDDVGDTRGNGDAWIIKIDASGNKVWSRTYGGDDTDAMNCVAVTSEGDLLMSGNSNSDNNGDVGPTHGSLDLWLLKLNGSGSKLWSKTMGGNSFEKGLSILPINSGEFIIGGTTYSNGTGDVPPSHGNYDVWLMKLK